MMREEEEGGEAGAAAERGRRRRAEEEDEWRRGSEASLEAENGKNTQARAASVSSTANASLHRSALDILSRPQCFSIKTPKDPTSRSPVRMTLAQYPCHDPSRW